jgi:hypothetical protein
MWVASMAIDPTIPEDPVDAVKIVCQTPCRLQRLKRL